jgi:hypothetical protein
VSDLDTPDDELPLAERDFAAYRQIAEGRPLPPGYAPDKLLALRLVDRDPYAPGGYIPNDPTAAVHGLTTAVLGELEQLVQRVSQIPALERLAEHFDPHRFYGGPGSEFLGTAAQMNARLGEIGGVPGPSSAPSSLESRPTATPPFSVWASSAPVPRYGEGFRSGRSTIAVPTNTARPGTMSPR